MFEDIFSRKDLIYTIYQEQSISKAAQKLFISQPSLSVMVKKIEDAIGLPLFDRSCKPLRLTQAGEEYIRATEKIRSVEASFANYVCAVNDLQAGSLGIGSNQLLSSLVLPKYIAAFLQAYPHIQLSLLDANSTILENKLLSGELDFIVDNLDLDPEIFDRRYLKTEELLLAVPAAYDVNRKLEAYQLTRQDILQGRHTAASFPCPPLKYFAQTPFILISRDNDTGNRSNAIFQEAGISPPVLLQLDRLVTLYNFVEIGTAASIVSDTLVQNTHTSHPDSVLFYKLPSAHARRDIFAIYKHSKYHSRAMEVFIQSLHHLE